MVLCLQGREYVDMLLVQDLSTDVVPQQLTNNTFSGGYAIVSSSAAPSLILFLLLPLLLLMLLHCCNIALRQVLGLHCSAVGA